MTLPAILKFSAVLLASASLATFAKPKPAGTGTPNEKRWASASIRSGWTVSLDKAVVRFQRDQKRYLAIQKQRSGGMPAPVVFGIHGRESTWDFSCHLHEGSPLTHRTRDVPAGRPLHPDPPYTFEQSAEDALYILKHEDRVNWRDTDAALAAIEAYNGTGYKSRGLPSPYLWSGTDQYGRGKFIRDHVYSATAVDQQPGVAAILIRMRERGISIPIR